MAKLTNLLRSCHDGVLTIGFRVLFVCVCGILSGPADAVSLVITDGVMNSIPYKQIHLDGSLELGDFDKVNRATERLGPAASLEFTFDVPGGSVYDGRKIAELIRLKKAITKVGPARDCSSICFLMFAAGSQKFVSTKAFMSVHRPFPQTEGGLREDTEDSLALTQTLSQIALSYGVPDSVVALMRNTPPSQAHWLTMRNLLEMGAIPLQPNSDDPVALGSP